MQRSYSPVIVTTSVFGILPNAQEPLEALIIPSERLRALMIAEAELGERNMRALIWRRVAILEAGYRRTDYPWSRRER